MQPDNIRKLKYENNHQEVSTRFCIEIIEAV